MGTHPIFESDFDCLTESLIVMSNNRKLLIASVLKYLKQEIDGKMITPDQEESLNVASQCLAMAFNTTPDDAEGLPCLLELLTEAAPDQMTKREATDEEREIANKLKSEGNQLMKDKKFKEAIERYSEAINVQESAFFYCNRAAAYTSIENYEEALQDCKKAISFEPDYSKAYSRMGLIYSKINLYAESENCYEKALKLEPDNESYKKNLEIVKEKLKEAPAAMPGMPGGMPDFSQMGQAMEQMMQNPQMRQMAEQMMQNPQMQNMMGNMMGQMGMPMPPMGGEEGGMPAGMPDMGAGGFNPAAMQAGMQMAQEMMRNNPEQVEEMRKMFQGMGGPPQ